MWLLLSLAPAQAHPYASSLDGAFLSFGMGLGGGSVLETSRDVPNTNAEENQAYNTKMEAYNNAMSALQADQSQTAAKLKALISSLDPNSQEFQTLITQISRLASDPASVGGSASAYQQYLNQILANYQSANTQLINNAQTSITNYQNALKTTAAQNQQNLQNALNVFNATNTKIAAVYKSLGLSYTPMSLPSPLTPNANVSSMSPQQVDSALQALSQEIDQAIAAANSQIQASSAKYQKQLTSLENAVSTTETAYTTTRTNALNEIVGVSTTLGKAFHQQWMDYVVGEALGVKPGAAINNLTFATSGRPCVFLNILGSAYKGSSNGCSPVGVSLPSGMSSEEVWGTLFNLSTLEQDVKIIAIPPSFSSTTNQNLMHETFENLNNYIGNSAFAGNFTNSQLYQELESDLSPTNSQTPNFTAAQGLVNSYISTMIPYMLNVFNVGSGGGGSNNPFWVLAEIPNSPSAQNALNDYIKQSGHSGESLPSGQLSFGQQAGWDGVSFKTLGVFGFNGVSNIMQEIDSQLASQQSTQAMLDQSAQVQTAQLGSNPIPQIFTTMQTDYSNYQNAQTALKNFEASHPASTPLSTPSISVVSPPALPKVSSSAATLPHVAAPQKPLLTITNTGLQSKSLQLGVQAQAGYQKYFNFFGISYYGYLGYRYLYMGSFVRDSSGVNSLDRYQVGFGANMLFNLYSKIKKTKAKHPKIQAYGLFGGLLGMVDIWSARFSGSSTAYVRNNVNINAVFGLSVRVDQFKWSIGIHMPLINQIRTVRTPLETGGSESLKIVDNYKSAALFMNFTEIF
ncbi:hypothetical protein [Helicobacter felistomachi]|uniref:hypothetical protein n=1 Tax=Helicobacter felistomachi TaxID=3040201 RepID=UPI002572E5E4|nr:hypothetical protein [Helicobacter sp. NHP21005]